MRPLVLYHANCPDGFCAAWVAHRKLGDDADYVPVQYGQEPPDVVKRPVYLLDFSYKREVMAGIIGQAHSVCVLDHHKTAQAELTFPSCSADTMRSGEGRIHIHFDMDKSGGRLAWEYFFPGMSSPWLVDYTEDRDLWRWKIGYSKEISAFISSHPFAFALWDAWDRTRPAWQTNGNEFVDQGAAILRYKDQLVHSAVENAVETDLAGHKVLAVNTTVCFSEVAGELAKGRPFGAAYFIRGDGKKQWSLRSTPEGVDVSEIAKRFGGGGHRNAAGFEESAS